MNTHVAHMCVHLFCRIGKTRRENYEGSRGRERGGGSENFTANETRKWDEGPRGEVEGNGDPHSETSPMVKPTNLKINQGDNVKGSKLIRFLR
jgi:hypothetical protein